MEPNINFLTDEHIAVGEQLAKYCVRTAYRYCLVLSCRNQQICPKCGQEMKGHQAFVCIAAEDAALTIYYPRQGI